MSQRVEGTRMESGKGSRVLKRRPIRQRKPKREPVGGREGVYRGMPVTKRLMLETRSGTS